MRDPGAFDANDLGCGGAKELEETGPYPTEARQNERHEGHPSPNGSGGGVIRGKLLSFGLAHYVVRLGHPSPGVGGGVRVGDHDVPVRGALAGGGAVDDEAWDGEVGAVHAHPREAGLRRAAAGEGQVGLRLVVGEGGGELELEGRFALDVVDRAVVQAADVRAAAVEVRLGLWPPSEHTAQADSHTILTLTVQVR